MVARLAIYCHTPGPEVECLGVSSITLSNFSISFQNAAVKSTIFMRIGKIEGTKYVVK